MNLIKDQLKRTPARPNFTLKEEQSIYHQNKLSHQPYDCLKQIKQSRNFIYIKQIIYNLLKNLPNIN